MKNCAAKHWISLASAALVVTLALTTIAPAAAAKPRATGPRVVVPGKIVTFHAFEFQPGAHIAIVLRPRVSRGGGAGDAAVLRKRWIVDGGGFARLRFRWPRHYKGCFGTIEHPDCRNNLTWRPGSRAQVIVSSKSLSTGGIFKWVKIRRRPNRH